MRVVGVTWKLQDDETFMSGLRVWKDGDTPEFIPITTGEQLSLVFRSPRRCVGSVNSLLKSIRCPEDSIILQRRNTRCGSCSAIDFVDPCIRCDGRTCLATSDRRAQCDDTRYAVYLVVFNDETLKVGVSSEKRVRTRWVEQGADFGGVLHLVQGGINARRIEDRLGKNPKVVKQVRGERKIRGLMHKLNLDVAQSIVEDFILETESDELGANVELEDLSSYYSLEDVDTRPHSWRSKNIPIDNRPLVGKVVGMKGSLLVTSLGSAFTVADLKQVIGYRLDYDEDIILLTQSGLMDFF